MTTIRVEGVKETIKTLGEIDPELKKAFTRDAKKIAKPIVDAAKASYAGKNFPSGTRRRWSQKGRDLFPLDSQKAAKGMTSSVSTSRRNASAIVVIQKNPGAAIFEFAQSGGLGAAFSAKNGGTPRVVWPAAESQLPNVSSEMEKLVESASRTIQERLY